MGPLISIDGKDNATLRTPVVNNSGLMSLSSTEFDDLIWIERTGTGL